MTGTLKTIALGVWAAMVALAATYMAATWSSGETVDVVRSEQRPTAGLQFQSPGAITVPMISEGALKGYVVAKVAFTADADALQAVPFDPRPFILDEAFRTIYTDGRVEFSHLSKYNLAEMTDSIRKAVNARLGTELVKDILVEELNYVDMKQMKQQATETAAAH